MYLVNGVVTVAHPTNKVVTVGHLTDGVVTFALLTNGEVTTVAHLAKGGHYRNILN